MPSKLDRAPRPQTDQRPDPEALPDPPSAEAI